jgi:hypothetical protein
MNSCADWSRLSEAFREPHGSRQLKLEYLYRLKGQRRIKECVLCKSKRTRSAPLALKLR